MLSREIQTRLVLPGCAHRRMAVHESGEREGPMYPARKCVCTRTVPLCLKKIQLKESSASLVLTMLTTFLFSIYYFTEGKSKR